MRHWNPAMPEGFALAIQTRAGGCSRKPGRRRRLIWGDGDVSASHDIGREPARRVAMRQVKWHPQPIFFCSEKSQLEDLDRMIDDRLSLFLMELGVCVPPPSPWSLDHLCTRPSTFPSYSQRWATGPSVSPPPPHPCPLPLIAMASSAVRLARAGPGVATTTWAAVTGPAAAVGMAASAVAAPLSRGSALLPLRAPLQPLRWASLASPPPSAAGWHMASSHPTGGWPPRGLGDLPGGSGGGGGGAPRRDGWAGRRLSTAAVAAAAAAAGAATSTAGGAVVTADAATAATGAADTAAAGRVPPLMPAVTLYQYVPCPYCALTSAVMLWVLLVCGGRRGCSMGWGCPLCGQCRGVEWPTALCVVEDGWEARCHDTQGLQGLRTSGGGCVMCGSCCVLLALCACADDCLCCA